MSTSRLKNDLTGKRIGRYLIALYVGGRASKWLCRCDCGKERLVSSGNLRSGRVQSCGCYHSTELSSRQTKHGHRRGRKDTPEYKAWSNMKRRCYSPKVFLYERYGGRGITVCDKWKNSFESFLRDMGNRPSPNHSIDRIDVNGNYEPANCRWATRQQQMSNTSRNRIVVIDGVEMTQAEAARRAGLSVSGFRYRLKLQEAVCVNQSA